jgi:hypothetical protein
MKSQTKGGESFVGWIANINNGTIENCENYAPLYHKSNYTNGNVYVGGITGSNRYVVYRCRNYGEVNSASIACGREQNKEVAVYVGGIAGGAYAKSLQAATIARCENHGAVK